MAIFGPKPWVNPFGKMSIFRLFGRLVFKAQKGVFSFQNIIKDFFLAYIAKKKKFEKMAIFRPKPQVNPFEKKGNISSFWTSCFYSLERRVFVLEYHKRYFPGLYSLTKKNLEKWLFLDQNHRLTPLKKKAIFRVFGLLVFIAQKGVFSFQNIIKDIFLAYIRLQKKNLEKWPFLDQNHGLTRLEKCQFFDFLNFLFLQPRKAFFRSRIS